MYEGGVFLFGIGRRFVLVKISYYLFFLFFFLVVHMVYLLDSFWRVQFFLW